MASNYGDMCKELREEKRLKRQLYGKPCLECVRLLPKANPSILLPGQKCKMHNYRAPKELEQ